VNCASSIRGNAGVTNFNRDPGPLRLAGIRAPDAHSITGWLRDVSAAGGLLAADLSLGAWRHFQVACDFFAQLGLEDPISRLLASRRLDPAVREGAPARGVGHLIDRETLGDSTVLDAFRLAREAFQALSKRKRATLCVVTGSHSLAWEPADALFVRFLAQALASTAHRLLIVTSGRPDAQLPPDWIVSWSKVPTAKELPITGYPDSILLLVPGVITAEVRRLLDPKHTGAEALIRLTGGCFLIPPALRRATAKVPPEGFEQLAEAASKISSLASYGSYWSADTAINPSLLWEHARTVFDAGGLGIAIRLLERAIRAARTPTERAVFELLAQGARIRSGRFQDATHVVVPDKRIAQELKGWLWFTKGWGLTMLEKPAEAELCLQRARKLLASIGKADEYLYVLNISALNRLKLEDWDGAFALEQRIRSQLDRVNSGRWQIAYINSLNLARLSRRRDDFEGAERYYRDAFSTSYGAWSDSDAMYFSVCLARLYEAQQRHSDALCAWARAALYWVSSPVPESIGGRVTGAVTGSGAPQLAGNLMDEVALALISHLLANARGAGLRSVLYAIETASPSEAVSFVRSSDFAPPEEGCFCVWHALRVAGNFVFGIAAETGSILESEPNRHLRTLLASLGCPAVTHRDQAIRTIVVDDGQGCGLPESEASFLAVCLRLGLRTVAIEGRRIELDRMTCAWLERRLYVRLASIVSRVSQQKGQVVIVFKRYLPPRTLSGPAANLVRLIADLSPAEIRVARLVTRGKFNLSLLRALERDRIVELFLPKDVSIAALTGEEGV